MSLAYRILLTGHILSAAAWVGGGLMLQILGVRLRRSAGTDVLAALMREKEWTTTRVIAPLAGLTLALGLGLVFVGDWSPTAPWILFALLAWGTSALNGSLYLGPEAKRLGALIEAQGADAPEVQAGVARYLRVLRLEVILVMLVVADMTIKPGA